MEALLKLCERLDRIAKANGDDFRFTVTVCPDSRRKCRTFQFDAIESVDGHVFVGGIGSTIEDAVVHAESGIEAACKEWGYELCT